MTAAGNILVGGGTGFIGTHLCRALKSKGYAVTIVSRMPGPQRLSWSDLISRGLPKETSAVVNLAGQNVMDFTKRWTVGFKQNVFNSRVNTTNTLAKVIESTEKKPRAFVTISGVGVYKPDKSIEYNEDSECAEFDFFSNLCKNWEKAANLSDKSREKCRVVTVRSGVVLGRDGGMMKELYLPFCLGLGGPIGDGNQYLPFIHVEDLVGLLIFAIESDNVEGILNGVAPNPCTNKEFSKAFGKAMNRPAFIPVPRFVLELLLNKERAVMMTEGQKVVPRKTLSSGFQFKYPTIDLACKAVVNAK